MSKKLKFGALAVASFAVVVIALASSSFLLRHGAQYLLRHNGFPNAHVADFSLTPEGFYIENISLDGNEFSTVSNVDIQLNWLTALFTHKIQAIKIKNLSLSGEVDESGHFTIAGWDATLPNSGNANAPPPFQSLSLNGITLDYTTPYGDIRIEGKLSYQVNEQGNQSFQSSFWGKQQQLTLSMTLSGQKSPGQNWDLSSELQDGRVEIPDLQITRLSGWFHNKGADQAGQLSAGSVKFLGTLLQNIDVVLDTTKPDRLFFKTSPAGHPGIVLTGSWNTALPDPLSLELSADKASDLLALSSNKAPDPLWAGWLSRLDNVTLKLSTTFDKAFGSANPAANWAVTAMGDKVSVKGSAIYNRAEQSLSLHIAPSLIPVQTLSDMLPLQDKYSLAFTDGTLSVSGDYPSALQIGISNAAGTWSSYPFTGLESVLNLGGISPWKLSKPATVKLKTFDAGSRLENGQTTLSGAADKGLHIDTTQFDLAGGQLAISPFTLTDTKPAKLTATLTKVDMGKLALAANVSGLSAAGTVSGSIPIELRATGPVFQSGRIQSDAPGAFKYTPASFPSALQGDDTRMATVRQALSDFHFDSIELSVDGPLGGNLKTTLKASGTNPVFGDRPIQLNLNLEGALGAALTQTLTPGALPDAAQKAVEQTQKSSTNPKPPKRSAPAPASKH